MIDTAVILSSGLGTRMFPVGKVLPKSLLPIGRKPAIQFDIEECVVAGFKEIVVVVNRRGSLVEKFLRADTWLEKELKGHGKSAELAMVKKIEGIARFRFVVQKPLLGEVHALWCARNVLKGKNFAVMFNDRIYPPEFNALEQLCHVFERGQKHVYAVDRMIFRKDFLGKLKDLPFKRQFLNNPKGLSFYEVIGGMNNEEYIKIDLPVKSFDIGDESGYLEAIGKIALKSDENG